MKKLIVTIVSIVLFLTANVVHALPPVFSGPPVVINLPTKDIISSKIDWVQVYWDSALTGVALSLVVNSINNSSYTFMPTSGHILGNNTQGVKGAGVTWTNAGFELSGIGVGVGWDYSMVIVNGVSCLQLSVVTKLPFSESTSHYILGPEDIGVQAYDAALYHLTGRLSDDMINTFINSSEATRGSYSPWVFDFRSYSVTLLPIVPIP